MQHDAGQRQRFFKGFGGVHRVLALHGIDHEKGFYRIEQGVQVFDFLHQQLVNGQAAGGIDQQHVKVMFFGVIERGAGDVLGFLVGGAGKPFGPGLGGDGFQLLDGRRAVHVARDSEHFLFALFDEVLGQFCRGGGFTRALQTGHQDDGRGLGGQVDVGHAFAHGGGQFGIDDAHQRLAGL